MSSTTASTSTKRSAEKAGLGEPEKVLWLCRKVRTLNKTTGKTQFIPVGIILKETAKTWFVRKYSHDAFFGVVGVNTQIRKQRKPQHRGLYVRGKRAMVFWTEEHRYLELFKPTCTGELWDARRWYANGQQLREQN